MTRADPAATAQQAHQAKKRFGQNFLHDPGVIERILRAVHAQPGQTLVEIGPGLGALTAPLLQRCGRLQVVELDRDVIPLLRQRCAGLGELDVLNADALKTDFSRFVPSGGLAGGQIRLVGNLPYNISTPLLFHLLEQSHAIADMHFMLQKEVVDRMAAGPGEDDYGRLSVALAARCTVEALFVVGPGAFTPPPKVHSAVVRLVPRPAPFELHDWRSFDTVLVRAFSQRRKTLANALKGLVDAKGFAAAGIDPGLRAERLSAAEFARLANTLPA